MEEGEAPVLPLLLLRGVESRWCRVETPSAPELSTLPVGEPGSRWHYTLIQQPLPPWPPAGFNVPYEFSQGDVAAATQFIQNHIGDLPPGAQPDWPTIRYMLADIQYAGRITDDFDRLLMVGLSWNWEGWQAAGGVGQAGCVDGFCNG